MGKQKQNDQQNKRSTETKTKQPNVKDNIAKYEKQKQTMGKEKQERTERNQESKNRK